MECMCKSQQWAVGLSVRIGYSARRGVNWIAKKISKPKSWQNLNSKKILKKLKSYTSQVLAEFLLFEQKPKKLSRQKIKEIKDKKFLKILKSYTSQVLPEFLKFE